jgi:hypothetical protein
MRTNWSAVLQNVLSGCVGGLLVIGVAHAADSQPKAFAKVISASKFELVDSNQKVRGYFGIDDSDNKSMIGLLSGDDHYSCVMSADNSRALLQIGSTGTNAVLSATDAKGAYASVRTSNNRNVLLEASPSDQFVMVNGENASIAAKNDHGGSAMMSAEPPLFGLVEKPGHVIWQQR